MKIKGRLNEKTIFLTLLLLALGCIGEIEKKLIEQDTKSTQISKETIDSVSTKRIFFSHISVGYNILDGVEKIMKTNDRFKIIKVIELSKNTEPAIYRTRNG